MMKKNGKGFTFALMIGAFSLLAVTASAQEIPPRGNLFMAKQAVARAQQQVQVLVYRISGGGGGGGDDNQCSAIMNYHQCIETQGCRWDREAGICTNIHRLNDVDHRLGATGDDGVDENDFAANFALQGMGSGLTNLGQKIDQATLAWGTPGFFAPWSQACSSASNLLLANQAAKVAANLPAPGLVSANDFVPIDQELTSVRSLLFCP